MSFLYAVCTISSQSRYWDNKSNVRLLDLAIRLQKNKMFFSKGYAYSKNEDTNHTSSNQVIWRDHCNQSSAHHSHDKDVDSFTIYSSVQAERDSCHPKRLLNAYKQWLEGRRTSNDSTFVVRFIGIRFVLAKNSWLAICMKVNGLYIQSMPQSPAQALSSRT